MAGALVDVRGRASTPAYMADTIAQRPSALVDARSTLTSTESSLASNLYNTHNRERRLMGATGRIYDIVGLRLAKK